MSQIAEPCKENRRRSQRRRPRGYAKVECRKGILGLGANVAVALMDLSETGARLVVKGELAAGQEVELVFAAHGVKKDLRRKGRVVWQLKMADGNYCLGVDFDKPLAYVDWQNIVVPS